jgi:cytidyltransferase-like protein
MNEKFVLVTGGFDPLHSGHIAYFKAAKKLGNKLVVGLNSDEWLARKKGKAFMPFTERLSIIKELEIVDKVISFNDDDNTACGAIFYMLSTTGNTDQIIFANGGDREQSNIPEYQMYKDQRNVSFEFGVGGTDKKNSSSWILEDWKAPKTQRTWGHYRNLYKGDGFQVKELVINPKSKLSMQRHKHRSETWNIVSGKAYIKTNIGISTDPFEGCTVRDLHPNNPVDVPAGTWHQGCNDTSEPAHIVEIWKGDSNKLTEEDIERYDL